MSALTEERTTLANELEALTGIKAYNHIPERFNPAAIFCAPGAPYITAGSTFGRHVAHFEVWIISPTGDNKKVTDFLDDAITSSIEYLIANGWNVEEVGEPFLCPVQNNNHLAVVIHVNTGFNFLTP